MPHQQDCRIAWQVLSKKIDEKIQISFRDRSECKWPFSKSVVLHRKVIETIMKNSTPKSVKTISTGGLGNLQPDGSRSVLSGTAKKSLEQKEIRQKFLNKSSPPSTDDIFSNFVRETRSYEPFTTMLADYGLLFEFDSAEKVFSSKSEAGEIILDAATLWWKPI